jgi:hypothetical protein
MVGAGPPVGLPSSPHPYSSMMLIRGFVRTLAVARKNFNSKSKTVKDTDGDRILKQMQIYNIIKKARRGNLLLTTKRKKRSLAFIADVVVDIEKGWYVTVKKLAPAHGVSMKTILTRI